MWVLGSSLSEAAEEIRRGVVEKLEGRYRVLLQSIGGVALGGCSDYVGCFLVDCVWSKKKG